MAKLNQIIAIEKGIKAEASRVETEVYHKFQKETLLSGIARKYEPLKEDGEILPDESTKVQTNVGDELTRMCESLTKLFDITCTKDAANQTAKANVEVDGVVVLQDVPVCTLLFLEKKLTDLHTNVKKLPVLNPAEDWVFDATTNVWRTPPSKSIRSKKVMKAFERSPATQHHPAQVDTFTEDEPVGTWSTMKFSGSLPQRQVTETLARVEKLQQAVKFAREAANSIDVTDQKIGKKVLGYVFGQ
jgi:hypothetical protein